MGETQFDTSENLTGNPDEDLTASLMQARAEQQDKEKAEFEANVIQRLFEKYPEEQRKNIKTLGGMEIIACGAEPTSEQLQTVENAFNKIRERIGDTAEIIFAGLKVYLAPDAPGGGQALGRENAVILNTSKMGITVGEMEAMLAPTGQYRKGDQSKVVGESADAAELGTVHELGHILEFRAHGDYDIGYKTLDQSEAPTEYGQKHAREDYAESWMYYIYGGALDDARKQIIEDDIEKVSEKVNS